MSCNASCPFSSFRSWLICHLFRKALPDLEQPVWTWWHFHSFNDKMSLWFIFRLGPLGARVLPLLFTSVFPPLICHLPGRMSGKSSGLELWRPGFIILTPPHVSYETRGKQTHHLSGPQFPYLENGHGNLPSRTTGKTGALICARVASTALARHGCSVHVVGFPSLFLLSRGREEREASPNLALIRPLMTALPA